MKQPSLFDGPGPAGPPGRPPVPPDQAARDFAVEPGHDVVLEASAGTGKTRVLVDRYVRLLEHGVDPAHVLAITFTRKAAAEMRERVLAELRTRASDGRLAAERWRELRRRISDIQISTIDAFCHALLREFPLEADVEPGFDIADETEMGRFAGEAVDQALRIARGRLGRDEPLRLLFARVKLPVLADAMKTLIDRRHVALPAVATFVRQRGADASAAAAALSWARAIRRLVDESPHRTALLDDGPHRAAEFRWVHGDLSTLSPEAMRDDASRLPQIRRRLERYFLTKNGEPRRRTHQGFKAADFASVDARRAHDGAVAAFAPGLKEALDRLDADIDAVLAGGLLHLLKIASARYESLLEEHGVLDFAGMLDRAVRLLSRQEEFARSRLKLQSRYRHVLVDEFQDTSRAQWRLVELLVDAWGEGEGVTDAPTSIFVVGDRKQSIYRFRHAEVTLLDEAARKIEALRPHRRVRQAISTSFRAVPELLAFVNALAQQVAEGPDIPERFSYTELDRFPAPDVAPGALRDGRPVLGVIAEPSMAEAADAVAAEIQRAIGREIVRDRDGGPNRLARPDDIAILFRARAGHQRYEAALEARGIRTYVYKGLGFFDAPEVQDLQALLRYFAQPDSDLRAAEWLRSRFVRVSDVGLARLAPDFAQALSGDAPPARLAALDDEDRALLEAARESGRRWRPLAHRVMPGEFVATVMAESAYAWELGGRRLDQARENVKKVMALVRRVESRGYATLDRLAAYFDTLRTSDESHAIIEASGCVSLMTMHAAKGLEYPIVFLVNLQAPAKGRSGGPAVIERDANGDPHVAFSSNAVTRLEDERENEELRRLLYVATTRARDRLYLAAQVDARGQVRRHAQSLARLLPLSLTAVFADAAADPARARVDWQTSEGRFTFDVCRAGAIVASVGAPVEPAAAVVDDAPLAAAGRAIVAAAPSPAAAEAAPRSATEPARPAARGRRRSAPAIPPALERLAGTLVHRLFQRDVEAALDAAAVAALVPALASPAEGVDVLDWPAFAAQVAAVYLHLKGREDVRAALASGRRFYEVPFSFVPPGEPSLLVRGSIDCLVVPDAGPPMVLEVKTGQPRPEHEAQAARYAAAIGAIMGVDRVETKILYAGA